MPDSCFIQLLPFSTPPSPSLPPSPSPLPLISSPPPSLTSPLLFPHSSPFSPPLFLSSPLLPSSSSLPKVPAPPALCPSPRPATVGKLLPGRCTAVNQANSTSLVEQFATGTLFTIIVTSIYLTENVNSDFFNTCSPRELDCGNHLCETPCHQGECPSCPLLPIHVNVCPCGATPLSELLLDGMNRTSCLDPVPTCTKTCGRLLPCSTLGRSFSVPRPAPSLGELQYKVFQSSSIHVFMCVIRRTL